MLVQGWILGSIGDDALDAVWDKTTAREIWLELDNIFKEQEQQHEEEEEANDRDKSGKFIYVFLYVCVYWPRCGD